jgi:hypothetical protein
VERHVRRSSKSEGGSDTHHVSNPADGFREGLDPSYAGSQTDIGEETFMRSLFLVSILLLGFAATVRPADAADVRMYIRHEVADYAVWRKAYNAFDATRRKLGVTGQAVYQSVDNANDVTVTHDFNRGQGQGLRIVAGSEDDDGESRRQGHPANLVHYQRRQVACRSPRRPLARLLTMRVSLALRADLPPWQIKFLRSAAANQPDGQITSDFQK